MAAPRDVVADPIGVIVDLVTSVEPTVDRAVIENVAAAVTGGRAKRRTLAQALLDNPNVLVDGRSPTRAMSTSRALCRGSTRSIGQRTQACSWAHGVPQSRPQIPSSTLRSSKFHCTKACRHASTRSRP